MIGGLGMFSCIDVDIMFGNAGIILPTVWGQSQSTKKTEGVKMKSNQIAYCLSFQLTLHSGIYLH